MALFVFFCCVVLKPSDVVYAVFLCDHYVNCEWQRPTTRLPAQHVITADNWAVGMDQLIDSKMIDQFRVRG